MSVQLSFPMYSFVQAASAAESCYPDPDFCLPISASTNLQFYINVSGIDMTDYSDVTNILFYAYVVPSSTLTAPSGLSSYNSFTGSNTPLLFGNHYSPASGASMEVHFEQAWCPDVSDQVDVGECFRLMIAFTPVNASTYEVWPTLLAGFTNCFQRINTDSCYTSVLVYSNNSDAFGFQAMDGHDGLPGGIVLPSIDPPDNSIRLPNIIELPMYLRDPKMENDQKVYTKSDGTLVKLYERKEEIYMLETELMPYSWHKALDVALSHDNVFILNPNASSFDPYNTATQFVKKENYEIEYQKAPLSALGKGTCKLSNADAINLINNNCA